jgi:hypothetical protein
LTVFHGEPNSCRDAVSRPPPWRSTAEKKFSVVSSPYLPTRYFTIR